MLVTTGGPTGGLAQKGFEKGAQAYFNQLNANGGVNGRKIVLTANHNDDGDGARNKVEFTNLVEQEKVFGVLSSVPIFGASEYAVQQGVPTVGTAYDTTWQTGDNLLATMGSWKRADPNAQLPAASSQFASTAYLAKKLGATKAGVFAYNHPQSRQFATDACHAFDAYGVECVYEESSLAFGFTDLGSSVEKVKESGATFFFAAMDAAGSMAIMKSLKRAGMNDVSIQAPVGYGQDTIDGFPADLLEHFFLVNQTPPFEAADTIPALEKFVNQMKTDFPDESLGTPQLNGWIAATLLKDGLEAAGPDPTRAGFVQAVRGFTAWDSGLGATVNFAEDPNVALRAPGYKPDPDSCGGYVLRVDTEAKKWAQVGMKPILCLKGATNGAELDAVVADDDSSMDP